mmetsp:Transcript_35648/g.107252  ORF Transcript_35648/g.107252 Transcript_35648/m.107252 type:complete len:85 (+) Transcript_35648:183-437(+)
MALSSVQVVSGLTLVAAVRVHLPEGTVVQFGAVRVWPWPTDGLGNRGDMWTAVTPTEHLDEAAAEIAWDESPRCACVDLWVENE